MTSRGKMAFVVVAVVMGLAATLLSRLHGLQRLGTPGVRIVARPVYGTDGRVVGTNTVDLPARVLNYESKEEPQQDEVLNWLPKDTTLAQRFYQATNAPPMLINAVVMGTDRTSIHKPEYCLRGQGFAIDKMEEGSVVVETPHRYVLPVTRVTCTRQGQAPDGTRMTQRAVYVFWFVADGQLTASHSQRMKWMARDLIFHQTLQRWAYVSCFSVCQPGQEDLLYARMQQFIAAAVPQFQLASGPIEQASAR